MLDWMAGRPFAHFSVASCVFLTVFVDLLLVLMFCFLFSRIPRFLVILYDSFLSFLTFNLWEIEQYPC